MLMSLLFLFIFDTALENGMNLYFGSRWDGGEGMVGRGRRIFGGVSAFGIGGYSNCSSILFSVEVFNVDTMTEKRVWALVYRSVQILALLITSYLILDKLLYHSSTSPVKWV